MILMATYKEIKNRKKKCGWLSDSEAKLMVNFLQDYLRKAPIQTFPRFLVIAVALMVVQWTTAKQMVAL